MDKDVFKDGIIRIKVMNANVILKNDLIGAYAFDAAQVYYKKDHEMHRIWVALMNDEDPEDTGVQGYLKLSVQIVGPGDKLKVHDEEEDMKKEREAMLKSGGDIGSMVVMPPTIKKEWKYLVTTVYRAEYLPVMDQSVAQVLTKNGTDAFFQVEFAGGKPLKTKVKTVKGDRSAMNPRFNYELWYPVSVPTMTQTIKCSMWDHDTVGANELIATCYGKFNVINNLSGQRTPAHWVNFYGAPENAGVSIKNMVAGAANKVKNLGGVDFKHLYNTFPDQGSNFKGRVLLSYRIESQRPKKYDKDEIEPFRRSCRKLSAKQEPPTLTYILKAIVVSGTELPQFVDPTNPLKKQKLQVRISIGQYELFTQRVDVRGGVSEWNEFLQSEEMQLPADISQIPDIFVHLCKGKGKDLKAICFSRYKAADIIKTGFRAAAEWILLGEDKSIDALVDGEFPGNVMVKLGFGEPHDALATVDEWNSCLQRIKIRTPYQLRVHVYQGHDLPAADSNGLLDPYLKINFLGETKKSTEKYKTRYPLYYETVVFDCQLPEREFAPQVNVQLWDKDFALEGDDYMGMCFFNLKGAYILDSLDDPLIDPEYISLFIEKPGDGQGSLLLGFQLIPKTKPDMIIPPPPSIKPSLREAWIEIVALGLRDMAPFNFQSMVSPYLNIELETPEKVERIQTMSSKKPEPENANFLERLVLPVKLPDNALFATPLILRAHDTRLGGFMTPEVAVGSVSLVDKIPWSKSYKPPQSDIFFQNSLNRSEGYIAGAAPPGGEGGDPPLDSTAQAAIELIEKRKAQIDEDEFVLTQEPISVDEFVKKRILQEDTGAGVFGALAHLELPEYGGKKKKTAEDFFEEIDFEEEEDDGPPKYMVNREKLPSELEDKLKTTPFETYILTRGQVNGLFGSTLKTVGRFKGLIRVMSSKDEEPLFDLSQLLKPQGYKVRLYCLAATNLTPMDMGFGGRPGKSDPYLKVTLGKQVFDDRENAVDDVTDVDLYKMVEFNAELPGTSQLIIEVMDQDDIGSDDLIGKTIIDLEDRWFDNRWQEMGQENRVLPDADPNNIRWDTKALEKRSLYVPSSNNAQGVLECWVDIMTPAEASTFPPEDVALPPRQMFEVRVVIWKTKDVPAQDTLGGQNMTDLYVDVWPEGCDKQTTDTHWRCKKGKGSFNWRMLFDVELGHRTRAMKFPYLHIQMWDKDLLKWNDCIAEGTVDLGMLCKMSSIIFSYVD